MDWQSVSPYPIENLYHVCVVVDDFDAALREIGGQLGIDSWTPPVATPARGFRRADGTIVTTPVRAAFSHRGPPHLEIIEGHDEPNSLWPRGPGPRLDHIGVHVADAATEAERLIAGGLILEAEFMDLPSAVDGVPASRKVYYLRDPLGIRIEVVDASRRPYLKSWLEQGTYPQP